MKRPIIARFALALGLLLMTAMPIQAQEESASPQQPSSEVVAQERDLSHHLQDAVPNPPATPDKSVDDARIEQFFSEEFGHGGSHHRVPAVAVIAVIFIFGGPLIASLVLIIMHYRSRLKLAEIQRDNIARVLESGQDVPLDWLRDDRDDPQYNLRRGLRNLGIGTGLLIFLSLLVGFEIGSLGFIPVGIGLAQLAIWRLTRDDR